MTEGPFITFYTPTYRRPQGLQDCLESVRTQTLVRDIEQIVIPDHLGRGIGGMYSVVPLYVNAVHGQYVHLLCDDDVLASHDAVEALRTFAYENGTPPLIIVGSMKGGRTFPLGSNVWPPVEGFIDLGCAVVRHDVWKRHAGNYGLRYEGDFDFLRALHEDGVEATLCSLLFVIGDVRHGKPECST